MGPKGLCEVAADRSHPSHKPLSCVLDRNPLVNKNPKIHSGHSSSTSRLCLTLASPSGHLFWGMSG